jgi:hypothetical protein
VPTASVLVLGDLHEIFVAEFQRSVKADIDANGHSHNIRPGPRRCLLARVLVCAVILQQTRSWVPRVTCDWRSSAKKRTHGSCSFTLSKQEQL